MDLNILDASGKVSGTVQLPEKISGASVNRNLLHEVVTAYLANQRKGTHSSKTRSEVSGSMKKPWKQKHTGRARAGTSTSPLWKGGGIIFGPKPRSYRRDLPKSKVRAALAQAISSKATGGDIVVYGKPDLKEVKTKLFVSWMKGLNLPGKTLLVLDKSDGKIAQASRNLPDFRVIECRNLHPYDVLHAKKIVFTPEAVQCL